MRDGWYGMIRIGGLLDLTFVSSDKINYGEGDSVENLIAKGYAFQPMVVMSQADYDKAIEDVFDKGIDFVVALRRGEQK